MGMLWLKVIVISLLGKMIKMDQEHKEELIREEQQEKREEPMRIWIEEHKDDLKEEYLDLYSDEFNQYCREEALKRLE